MNRTYFFLMSALISASSSQAMLKKKQDNIPIERVLKKKISNVALETNITNCTNHFCKDKNKSLQKLLRYKRTEHII